MKRLILILSIVVLITACEGRKNSRMTADPRADTTGSGAKMIDSGGTRPDSVIIDSTNYGPPKN